MLYLFSRLRSPAHSSCTSSGAAARKKRGFNLIESAIILAVIGLVIGGIWAASTGFYEDHKVSKTIQDIDVAARNIQNIISISDSANIGNGTGITALVRDSGAFPAGWVKGSSIKNPFGGNVSLSNYYGATYNNFNIQLFGIPRSACIKLIVKISSVRDMAETQKVRGAWTRIQANVTFPPSSDFSTFPISTSSADTACHQEEDNSIYIYYGYNRINH